MFVHYLISRFLTIIIQTRMFPTTFMMVSMDSTVVMATSVVSNMAE